MTQTKVEMIDDYAVEGDYDTIKRMNEFMKDKKVIDVKMNTVIAATGNFFTRYLVIYQEVGL